MSTPAPAPAPDAPGTTVIEAPGAATDAPPAPSETAPGTEAPGTPASPPETPPSAPEPEVLSDGKDVRAAAAKAADQAEPTKLGRTDAAKAGAQAVADLPDWAQRIIKDTRDEAAKTRVDAKAHAEKVALEARNAFAQDIGRALGLIKDDQAGEGDAVAPPTAEELLGQVEAEKESTRMARVELAIYKAAAANSADPLALLDSRAFLDVVKGIDPSDSESLQKAIQAAVEANPRLRLEEVAQVAAEPEPTPPPSGGSFAGGPSGRGNDVNDMSIDEFRKAYTASRRR